MEDNDKVGDLPNLNRRGKKNSDEGEKSHPAGSASTPEAHHGEEPHDDQKPSPVEVKFYYYGLPTEPPLVARTSRSPFDRKLQPKALSNVGAHPLARIWPSVLQDIVRALAPVDWSTIDLLRIGHQGTKEKDWPVTLMVAVATGTSWEHASPVAAACKEILQHRGIYDVECEIRESGHFFSAADKLISADDMVGRPREEKLLSECIGQPISPCSTPSLQGTLGMYLQVGTGGTMCALTCRHVVMGTMEAESASKEPVTHRGYRRGISQPGKAAYDTIVSETRLTEGGESAFLRRLASQKLIEARRIGHVLYSPPRLMDQEKRLHDWLLVKLDSARYANLATLQNWLWVGRDGYLKMMQCLSGRVKPVRKANDFIVRLHGHVSKAEIFRAAHDDPLQDHKALWVHLMRNNPSKRLATGVSNEVSSVRRIKPAINSGDIILTREWCVVGRDGDNGGIARGIDSEHATLLPFSGKGDSGSVVFDSQGRIAGMLTGGVGRGQGLDNHFAYADVSYVTPIEVILDAIKAKYGAVRIP